MACETRKEKEETNVDMLGFLDRVYNHRSWYRSDSYCVDQDWDYRKVGRKD